jgi:hypothetical protein
MSLELTLDYVAPIPTGNRVQVVRAQRWVASVPGTSAYWAEVPSPLVVDLETNVVYCGDALGYALVSPPLAFKPDSNLKVVDMMEGRVTSCIVSSDRVGEVFVAKTHLIVEPTPQGYRQ